MSSIFANEQIEIGSVSRISKSHSSDTGSFTLRYREADSRKSRTSAGRKSPNPTRRLTGIFLEFADRNEARVAFFENGEPIEYFLPAAPLRQAGVRLKNQPFQLEEFCESSKDGSVSMTYRYLALADASDAYFEPASYDGKRQESWDQIIKAFEEAKD